MVVEESTLVGLSKLVGRDNGCCWLSYSAVVVVVVAFLLGDVEEVVVVEEFGHFFFFVLPFYRGFFLDWNGYCSQHPVEYHLPHSWRFMEW